MSRLYVWVDSDQRQTTLTTRANKQLALKVNYGSKDDSKPLVRVWIDYPKNPKTKPKIKIWRADNK